MNLLNTEEATACLSVAAHNGMFPTVVPPPLPPPPPPSTYGASTSPNLSPENIGMFGSAIRAETPEETLSRIAYGGFGGPVNATTSGGGNRFDGSVNATTSGGGTYSPPQEDDFPLF
uniref:Uncharacterized protein n=1 Tax=Arundo donax TaxID=35708 RepID=A0A0A9D530_ARUDO